MKKYSLTYRKIHRITAVLLLLAILIPTGLQAKQLADFCMMDHSDVEMATEHNCCPADIELTKKNVASLQHNDCNHGVICACDYGLSELDGGEWIVKKNNLTFHVDETESFSTFSNPVKVNLYNSDNRIDEHAPPLWLLYDTLLI